MYLALLNLGVDLPIAYIGTTPLPLSSFQAFHFKRDEM